MKTFILKISLILFCFFSLAASNAQITVVVPEFNIEVVDPEQVPTCYIFAIGLEVLGVYNSPIVEQPCTLTLKYLFPQTSFYNVPGDPFDAFRVHVIVTRMPSGIQYHAYGEWQNLSEITAGVNPDPITVYIR